MTRDRAIKEVSLDYGERGGWSKVEGFVSLISVAGESWHAEGRALKPVAHERAELERLRHILAWRQAPQDGPMVIGSLLLPPAIYIDRLQARVGVAYRMVTSLPTKP